MSLSAYEPRHCHFSILIPLLHYIIAKCTAGVLVSVGVLCSEESFCLETEVAKGPVLYWLDQLSNTANLWYIYVYYISITYMFRRLWLPTGTKIKILCIDIDLT